MYPKLYILYIIHFLEKLGRYYGEPLLIGQSLRFTSLLTSEIQFDSSSFGNGSEVSRPTCTPPGGHLGTSYEQNKKTILCTRHVIGF